MPYKSQAQSRYIHMKAHEGKPWAEKFVADSHGSKVPKQMHSHPHMPKLVKKSRLRMPK